MNFKMAINSIRGAKLRSFLTMLGIIIGVVSVVTFISFGEGLKRQIEDEIRSFGNDFLQINPGESIIRDEEGNIEDFDFLATFTAPPLTEKDLEAIKKLDNIKTATGFMLVANDISVPDNEQRGLFVMATEPAMLDILGQTIADGSFLDDKIENDYVAVLGSKIKEQLFGEASAIGRKVTIKNKEFTIIGVMSQYESLLAGGGIGGDFNRAVYIPLSAGKALSQSVAGFMEIDVKVTNVESIDQTIAAISESIKTTRGSDDFSVSKPEEFLSTVNNILGLLTTAVSAIASISVLVGGIGIMNIMFVTVSERTKEIGIRKAIGATNRQILLQFLIEAIVMTLFGAFLGVLASAGIGLIVRASTDFAPVITPGSIVIATVASAVFGVIFGVAPARRAARKDPIESLRHE
jgi:ABC-type antimicrobial peptide transport system permease subunit